VLCDQVIRENPASRGTETSAEVLVGPPWRMVSNAGQQQWYGGYSCTPSKYTAQRLATPLEQQHARLCTQPCTARSCSEGCLRSHAAILLTIAVRASLVFCSAFSAIARAKKDGAPPGQGKRPFPSKQGLHVRPRGLRTALATPMGSANALVASGNSSSSRSHVARTSRPRLPSTDRN
jgi:hypothetical protein